MIIHALPAVTVNNASICEGVTTVLNAGGAVTYNWSPANTLSAATGSSVTAFATNPTQYVVTGVDANGCSASAVAVVNVNPAPQIGVNNGAPSACFGSAVTMVAGGANAFEWMPGAGLSQTTGSVVVVSPVSSTTYTLVGTNAFGCADTLLIPFSVLALPTAVVGPDAQICQGYSVQLDAAATGSVTWAPAGTLDNSTVNNPLATPAQTTTYSMTVTGANGCTASDALVVTVINSDDIEVTGGEVVCFGSSALLQATGGYDYTWTPAIYLDNTTGSEVTTTPLETVTYTVTANAALGCPVTDTIVVTVKMPIEVDAGAGAQICYGEAYQLSAYGNGLTYEWTPAASLDNPFVPFPMATPETTTTYTVTSTDNGCFTDTATAVVIVNAQSTLTLAATQVSVVAGAGQQLFAQGTGTFAWSPPAGLSCTDCPDPIANPTHPTTYTVTLTDSSGCRSEDTVSLEFLCDENGIYIPNAFSPNGDNKNDVFRIRGYGIKEVTVFRVFSRWGELVFETTNAEEGWDGTFKNQPMFPAVYVYYVEGICTNDQVIVKQGNVTLIR